MAILVDRYCKGCDYLRSTLDHIKDAEMFCKQHPNSVYDFDCGAHYRRSIPRHVYSGRFCFKNCGTF